MDNYFNVKRFFSLSKTAYYNEWKPYLLTGIIIGSLYLLFAFLYGWAHKHLEVDFYLKLGLFIGVILTSRLFADLHRNETGTYYYTLPASLEEKYFLRFLATSFIYFIYLLLVLLVVSGAATLLNKLIFGNPLNFFNPFDPGLYRYLKIFCFFHAIFFFGSLYFKKFSFFKTTLSTIGVMFLVMVVFATIFRLFVFTDIYNLSSVAAHFNNVSFGINDIPGNPVTPYLKAVTGYVLPLLLYAAAYFRFKEQELKG